MNRTWWQALGIGALVALLVTIGAVHLVHRSTWNQALVAGMDRHRWHWPAGR